MQVYRKLWHLSFIWAPIVYYYFVERTTMIFTGFGFAAFFLSVDIIRMRWPGANKVAFKYFSFLLSEKERKSFNTSNYFVFACLICALFFEKKVGALAVVFLCIGDPVAAIVGTRYGTIKIFNKSLQGSAACFTACFIAAVFVFDWTIAFWAALTATLFELISSRINDNLSIPSFCPP